MKDLINVCFDVQIEFFSKKIIVFFLIDSKLVNLDSLLDLQGCQRFTNAVLALEA